MQYKTEREREQTAYDSAVEAFQQALAELMLRAFVLGGGLGFVVGVVGLAIFLAIVGEI